MQVSFNETQFTREQRQKRSNPSRNMTNYKAQGQHKRKDRWEARQSAFKSQGKA